MKRMYKLLGFRIFKKFGSSSQTMRNLQLQLNFTLLDFKFQCDNTDDQNLWNCKNRITK